MVPHSFVRIIGSAAHELPFIRMTLLEADGQVDTILLAEADFTHTGIQRERQLEVHALELGGLVTQSEFKYLPVTIGSRVRMESDRATDHHFNERLIRDAFTESYQLSDNDVVIALDADEVVYRASYPYVLHMASKRHPLRTNVRLPMRQFYYRVNLLWEGLTFTSAVAGRVRDLRRSSVAWRDAGYLLSGFVGCHFSWQLTTEQMIEKLGNYAHNSDYGHLANAQVLEDAVRTRTYPFDPHREFKLRRLSPEEAAAVYPASIAEVWQDLEHLVDSGEA